MEIKIATRQCLDQKGQQRRFHYYLTIDQERNAPPLLRNYGVRIAEELGDESSLSGVTTSAARIDELMALLVDNRVGPAGLSDVVADWL